MLRNGIARALISDVPLWMGGAEIIASLQDCRRQVELLPIKGGIVSFSEDRWDFRSGFRLQYRYQNTIDFKACHIEVKEYIKCFAVKCIDEGTKISTLHTTIRLLTQVINSAIEHSTKKMLLFLSTDDLSYAINTTQLGLFDRLTTFILTKRFVEYLSKEADINLCIDLQILERERKYISDRLGAKHQRKSHPDIPEELFNELITMFYQVLHDEKAPLNERLTAGMMLIESQLGLRKSEICALEIDCYNHHLCKDGIERPFVVYNCIKAAKGDVESVPIPAPCTALCKEAIEYYLILRSECIYANETDFMFIQNPHYSCKRNGLFPVDPETFAEKYRRLCIKYLTKVIQNDWKGISRTKFGKQNNETYSIPSIHSFRVHRASALYKNGYPLDFIECSMAHTPNLHFNDCYYGGVEANVPHPRIQISEGLINDFDNFMTLLDNDCYSD